jgi:hypothetical protein
MRYHSRGLQANGTMDQDELDDVRAPAIWFRRRAGGQSLSKLGGLPTLPSGIAWPRQHETGTPLHFLTQIDLSQLPRTPLESAPHAPVFPRSGILFFFADMVEEMLWDENGGPFATTRVIFGDGAGIEREPPSDMPEILHAFGELAGGYNTGIRIFPHASLEPFVIDTFGGSRIWSDDNSYTDAVISSIERALGSIPLFEGPQAWQAIKAAEPREYIRVTSYRGREGLPGYSRREFVCPMHQMLGVGKDVQGTAEEALTKGDILLLQIDSDRYVHDRFMFCDMGVAQYWIRPDDLAASRFDKAWATTEGG